MRSHAEGAEVRLRDGTPDQFLWRGRLYVVREVLTHWVEAGGWWRRPTVPGATPIDDAERECWRVEASRGRSGSTGVYDLCLDMAGGGWTVARVLD